MAQTISFGPASAKVISSLDTYNYTVVTAGLHTISVSMNEIPPSGLSIVIQQNSSTTATSITPAASQEIINLQTVLNCAANDVISIIVSSSLASEALPNIVKGLINIRRGTA